MLLAGSFLPSGVVGAAIDVAGVAAPPVDESLSESQIVVAKGWGQCESPITFPYFVGLSRRRLQEASSHNFEQLFFKISHPLLFNLSLGPLFFFWLTVAFLGTLGGGYQYSGPTECEEG